MKKSRSIGNAGRCILTDMPLLDIDDGVRFALSPTAISTATIRDTAERVATFIPHSGKTFGVKNGEDIHGISPVKITKNDILVVEPAIIPRDKDIVLLCLDYGSENRGVVAKLFVGLNGERAVKVGDSDIQPMPKNSLICGVVIEIKRRLIDNTLLVSRIHNEWNVLNTLIVDK